MSRRVLHPTDFSKASSAAFARALAEARLSRGELVVLHVMGPVIPPAGGGEGYIVPGLYEQMSKSARAWAQKQMDRLLAKAKTARVRARGQLLEGLAHEQIVRAAKRTRANVIVIGTHGRTGVARFFLGSVAARVAATAPCPVLTVRGRA
ncbi:MAG TPA: universal stress protein [Methylomirabilota bacterium]|jgi:nucleotide-binding universal stress UspA family protein|nr:universal stress protein [Methylomirabilota bacterium]